MRVKSSQLIKSCCTRPDSYRDGMAKNLLTLTPFATAQGRLPVTHLTAGPLVLTSEIPLGTLTQKLTLFNITTQINLQ